MINYHPTQAVLAAFAQGDLEDSIALIVASHVELCDHCQQEVARLTEAAAEEVFEQDSLEDFDSFQATTSSALEMASSISMLDDIMSLPTDDTSYGASDNQAFTDEYLTDEEPLTGEKTYLNQNNARIISHKDGQLPLPRALNSLNAAPWQGVGKVSRARFQFNDDERRLSLLKIDKGGQIPQHTHTGIEITLLLEGSFEDDMGSYQKGDFIWLDKDHTHSPITQEGCVCLTLVSDSLHFTQGLSKLLNPLGKLIY